MGPSADQDFLHSELGRTGRSLHRLGIAASFGIGGTDLEAAVEEHGIGYLYWGSMRTRSFAKAIRALVQRGRRDELFIVIQSYSRLACLVRPSLTRALKALGIEHADLLLLGWWNSGVAPRILDRASACQEAGLVRYLGVSTHQRALVPGFTAPGSPFDVVHFRYNAANRGAEVDVFPLLAAPMERAGTVAFTATRWRQLLTPPAGSSSVKVPTAGDCYRFVLSDPHVDVCMSGPASGGQLRETLAVLEQGPLAPDELTWIRDFGDQVYSAGGVRANLGERL